MEKLVLTPLSLKSAGNRLINPVRKESGRKDGVVLHRHGHLVERSDCIYIDDKGKVDAAKQFSREFPLKLP